MSAKSARTQDPRWIGSYQQIKAVQDRCDRGDADACRIYAAHRQLVDETRDAVRAERKANAARRREERRQSNNYPVKNGTIQQAGSADKGNYSSRLDSKGSTPKDTTEYTTITRRGVDEEGFEYTERVRVPVDQVPTVAASQGVEVAAAAENYYDAFGNAYSEPIAAAVADATQAGAAQVAENAELPENEEAQEVQEAQQVRPITNYAGQTSSPNYTEPNTTIILPNGQEVEITRDSFLQGLVGSLSDILGQGLSGLLDKLPGAIGDLLNATGLSGALSGLVGGLSESLGQALGDFTGALGDAAQGLLGGLGNAISEIPGVGPVFDQVTSDLGAFTDNLSAAYGGLDPTGKALVDGAIGAVGANLLNKVNIPGLDNIDPVAAGAVTAGLSFVTNPAVQLNTLANSAEQLSERIVGQINDPTIQNLASTARRAAREMAPALEQAPTGNWQFRNTLEEGNVENVRRVENGVVTPTPPVTPERQPAPPQPVITRQDAEAIKQEFLDRRYPDFDSAFNALRAANANSTLIQFGIQFSGASPREDGTYFLHL